MSIFKAYDIRGTYPDQIDEEIARKIGGAFAAFLGASRLVVGRDMRSMSPSVQDALIKGINEQGCDVLDIGLASTPMVYYAIGKLPCDGGVCVTASHNPKEYIGFKMCREGARPISGDSGIRDIGKVVGEGGIAPVDRHGKRDHVDIKSDYIDHILSFSDQEEPVTMAVDYANGMGAAEGMDILARIPGLTTLPIYEELDGSFPNHEANPLHEPNLDDLRTMVREKKAQLGISFDGDADRCAFVDEDGRTVHADLITAILVRGMLERAPGKGVIFDLRSSKVLPEEIERLGGRPVRERVGHSFMKETMRKEDCIGGGELSGHFYFAENYFSDSGILACIMTLNALGRSGESLKEAANKFRKYHQTPEINFRVEDKAGLMDRVAEIYSDGEIDWLDGVTVTYPQWWVNLRPSNTEPYLRLRLEADTAELLQEKRQAMIDLLGEPI
ncbi:MAG: phosphomannomutase/phosphoglucomutase [Planctomycetaceae bacterium]|nr:phosphomannomutase/phosphoglucomutase [Planctomycetaceae bacterium]